MLGMSIVTAQAQTTDDVRAGQGISQRASYRFCSIIALTRLSSRDFLFFAVVFDLVWRRCSLRLQARSQNLHTPTGTATPTEMILRPRDAAGAGEQAGEIEQRLVTTRPGDQRQPRRAARDRADGQIHLRQPG
jgi:hypothetical protein